MDMKMENLISESELRKLYGICIKRYNGIGEDVYGQVLVRGLQAIEKGKYDHAKGSFIAYLYAVIGSAAEDVLKSNGYIKKKPQPENYSNPKKARWIKMEEAEEEIETNGKHMPSQSQWHEFEDKYPGEWEKLEAAVATIRKKIKKDKLLAEIFELRIISNNLSLGDVAMRTWRKQKRVSIATICNHEKKLADIFAEELSKVFKKQVPPNVVLKFFKDKKEQKKERDSDLNIEPQKIQASLFF